MRKLKFRFWLNKKCQGILELEKGGILDIGWEWDSIDQFTGLLDRHGKEIYEGDIVKIGRTKFTIEFRDCGFEMIGIGIVCVARLCSAYRDIEIIGNIYENKNLLDPRI
ncbi:MAG: YopX family protein [Candidatus Omnitrophota bacterium]